MICTEARPLEELCEIWQRIFNRILEEDGEKNSEADTH